MLAALLLCLPGLLARAQQDAALTVDQVKAAFLYNFIKYTQWPENPGPLSVFHLCVLDGGAVGHELEKSVDGKVSGGTTVRVVRLTDATSAADCELVFVGGSSQNNEHRLLAMTAPIPVLTVGNTSEFLANGGLIRFIIEENRVRFDINVAGAAKANIKFDSRLLVLARSRIEVAR